MSNHSLPLRTSSKPIAMAAAMMLLCGTSAIAADLDPGYADVPAPIPQQNVTFGSGWYIRGDVGASEYPTAGTSVASLGSAPVITLDKNKRMLGFTASAAGGYAFTNSVRLEAMFDYHQPLHRVLNGPAFSCQNGYGLNTAGDQSFPTYGSCTGAYDAQINSYDTLINAYYDIGNWYGFTPYVGGGVGIGFGQYTTTATFTQFDQTAYDVNLTDPISGSTYHNNFNRSSNGTYYNFVWALMAGLSYDINSHIKVDAGYRYLNLGTILGTNYAVHQGKVGFRYMIDN